MNLYRNSTLRKIILPIIKKFSFDFWVRHPWVKGKNFYCNSFRHKGYWFHGRNRELQTMELFARIVPKGGLVVEVGGHIGFVSQYFLKLLGPDGRLIVFEPGANNLPYIRKNLKQPATSNQQPAEIDGLVSGVLLIEAAVGECSAEIDFYEDDLTGQNNSAVKDFDGFLRNAERAYVPTSIEMRRVRQVSLDEYFSMDTVEFIKIDIEGYEWHALQGSSSVIGRDQPILMVEIQADHDAIFQFFLKNSYLLFNDRLEKVETADKLTGNIFCFHSQKHHTLLETLLAQ